MPSGTMKRENGRRAHRVVRGQCDWPPTRISQPGRTPIVLGAGSPTTGAAIFEVRSSRGHDERGDGRRAHAWRAANAIGLLPAFSSRVEAQAYWARDRRHWDGHSMVGTAGKGPGSRGAVGRPCSRPRRGTAPQTERGQSPAFSDRRLPPRWDSLAAAESPPGKDHSLRAPPRHPTIGADGGQGDQNQPFQRSGIGRGYLAGARQIRRKDRRGRCRRRRRLRRRRRIVVVIVGVGVRVGVGVGSCCGGV